MIGQLWVVGAPRFVSNSNDGILVNAAKNSVMVYILDSHVPKLLGAPLLRPAVSMWYLQASG